MVTIKKYGKYYYVEGDDCYILYSLLHYKIKNDRCYFRKKNLERVLKSLEICHVNYKLKEDFKYLNNNYDYYLEEGKQKYLFDTYLSQIKNKMNQYVGKREFNHILRDIKRYIYG